MGQKNAVGRKPKGSKYIISTWRNGTAGSVMHHYCWWFKRRWTVLVALTLHSCQLCISCRWRCPAAWEFGCLWSWESHRTQQLLQERKYRLKPKDLCVLSMMKLVCVSTLPVPLRHCSVVVNPLVRGSRWYFSLGRPLLSATWLLIWCFVSVKRVPSQYSRNCGGRRAVFIPYIHL